jgi:prepilin-type N-terminal cleavage/methylation domain-containing protein
MKRVETEIKERGFTLLEVIIAVSIISIGLMALIPLLISSYKVDTQTAFRVRSQYVMAQKMDDLISQDTVSGGSTGIDYIDAQTGQVYSSAPSVPVVITRTWGVGVPADTLHPLNAITVTVTYTFRGETKTLTAYSRKGN